MKTFNLLLLFLIFSFRTMNGQYLEIVSPAINNRCDALTFFDKAYLAYENSDHMSSYDGRIFNRFDFPVRDGETLIYYLYKYKMVEYQSFIYLTFSRRRGDDIERYIYRFNGSSFEEFALPGDVLSGAIVFQGKLYVMAKTEGIVKVYEYDGTSLVEIPSLELPNDYHDLGIWGDDLVAVGYESGTLTVKRFTGAEIIEFSINRVTRPNYTFFLYPVPGSNQCYLYSHRDLYYFDGESVSSVIYPDLILDFTIGLNNSFYFFAYELGPGGTALIHKIENGSHTATFYMPDRSWWVEYSDMLIYENKLIFPVNIGRNSSKILEFDGLEFRDIIEFSRTIHVFLPRLRGPDYVFSVGPHFVGPTVDGFVMYKYECSNLTSIAPPRGMDIRFATFLTSTSSFHLWQTIHTPIDPHAREYDNKLAVEEKMPWPCPPTFSNIIPEYVRKFERFDFWIYARDRGWCWSDLFVDWKVDPLCPVPQVCPDPNFDVSLVDIKGNIAWNKQFQKPFQAKIPVDDTQAYKFALNSFSGNSMSNLIVFDENLVSKGLSTIGVTMVPEKDYFHLVAQTDHGEEVPFMMSLLDDKGEEIWKGEFMAPMDKEIVAKVDKPGTSLLFSPAYDNLKIQKEMNMSSIKLYPNPSRDNFQVEIFTEGPKETPVELTISNLNGQIVFQKSIYAPNIETIDLKNNSAGLYILKVASEHSVQTQIIKLEP